MTRLPSRAGSNDTPPHDTAPKGASPDIRAAFFDIDGTLTSFATHEIPASTVRALHSLQDRGIRIYICSGRAPSHMSVVLDTMPVDFDGIVAMNGQYCFDESGFLETESLDPHDVDVINRWLDGHPDVVANFCESDYVYFNQVTDTMRATWRQLGKTAPAVHIDDPHVRTPIHRTYQISPYIPPAAERELTSLCAHTTGVRWHPSFTDLIPSDGGKPRGIKRFGDRYGFTQKETIAFGDGGNDATMLRYAGIGVAMGNATEDAKAAADYVTDDVDHDGIMNALTHFSIL
jgi:Cof subfamily protein (haloacid dehalogenase superfamily)